MKFNELLKDLGACEEAIIWADQRTIEETVADCHRGDWLLWLATKINIDIKLLTKAKYLCALTVRHFMKDQRSITACEVAFKFADGEATREELDAAAADAYAADAAADSADAAAYSAAAAAYAAADSAAYAADAAYAAAVAYTDADARKKNSLETADICRAVLGEEIIQKVNQLLNEKAENNSMIDRVQR